MPWQELVYGTTPDSKLEQCAQTFRNTSRFIDSANFTIDTLKYRLVQVIENAATNPKNPYPKLPGDLEIDLTTRMFRMWRFYEGNESNPTLFTVALDRTLRRIGNAAGVFTPQRNHWCVSVGVATQAINTKNCLFIYDAIKALLKDVTQVPKHYRLALVWEARKATAAQELNVPDPFDPDQIYPPKVMVDGIFKLLWMDAAANPTSIMFYEIADGQIPVEKADPSTAGIMPAYRHFKSHISKHLPAGTQAEIRFLEFTIS